MVRSHPALFDEPYPERTVNNLYFDTVDLRFFYDHVRGTPNRMKVRVRWYGPFTSHIDRPALEIKTRYGAVGGKETHPLPPFELDGDIRRKAVMAVNGSGQLPGAAKTRFEGLQLALGNRYRRRYFASADGRVRLTVDSDLEFFECRGQGDDARPLLRRESQVIIELKFDPAYAEDAARVANYFPFRATRCSKYVIGIQRLLGESDA